MRCLARAELRLLNEHRAKIDAFDYDFYDGRADLDISGLRHAIERTPVNSKADALAALDLIRDEAKKREPDLIIQMSSRSESTKLRGESF
jgi:hypothetical protein